MIAERIERPQRANCVDGILVDAGVPNASQHASQVGMYHHHLQ